MLVSEGQSMPSFTSDVGEVGVSSLTPVESIVFPFSGILFDSSAGLADWISPDCSAQSSEEEV